MKRVIFSVIGTIAGLVALLSFKTESSSTATTAAGGLPSAGLPGADTSSAAPTVAGSTAAGSGTTGSSGPASPAPATAAPTTSTATSKSYLGTAITTRYGIVQVKITVAGKKITNVSFAQLTAFDRRSQEINSNAAPTLLQETLSAQSARIDTVSGATYTSQGYEQSLQAAIDQAAIG